MKDTGIRGYLSGILFPLLFFATLLGLEVYGHVIERGVGYYLKWHNAGRQQLGRVWDKERKNIIAQNKVQSILSTLDSQERSIESVESFKALFDTLTSPRTISRAKFLQLYFDNPGQLSPEIISPYELLEIDSDKSWSRVYLDRSASSITMNFIDRDNIPLHKIVLPATIFSDVQSLRTVKHGSLEDAGFEGHLIFSVKQFVPLIQTLDPTTQKMLFPDPKWFLQNSYHITRVGLSAKESAPLGIEYETDFSTEVLLVTVPWEIVNNVLSQIEQSDLGNTEARSGEIGEKSHGDKI